MTTNKPVKITAACSTDAAVALAIIEKPYKEGKRLVETLMLFVYSITELGAP